MDEEDRLSREEKRIQRAMERASSGESQKRKPITLPKPDALLPPPPDAPLQRHSSANDASVLKDKDNSSSSAAASSSLQRTGSSGSVTNTPPLQRAGSSGSVRYSAANLRRQESQERDVAPVFASGIGSESPSSREGMDWDRIVAEKKEEHRKMARKWDLESFLKSGEVPSTEDFENEASRDASQQEQTEESSSSSSSTKNSDVAAQLADLDNLANAAEASSTTTTKKPLVKKKSQPKMEIPQAEADKDLSRLLGMTFSSDKVDGPSSSAASSSSSNYYDASNSNSNSNYNATNYNASDRESAVAEASSLQYAGQQSGGHVIDSSRSGTDFKQVEASLNSLNFLIDDLSSSSDKLASQRKQEQEERERERERVRAHEQESKRMDAEAILAERAELERSLQRMDADRHQTSTSTSYTYEWNTTQDRRALEQNRERAKVEIARATKQALAHMDALIAGVGVVGGLVETFRRVEDALREALHPGLVLPQAYLTAQRASHDIIRLASQMLGIAAKNASSPSSQDRQEMERLKGQIRAQLVTLLQEIINTPLIPSNSAPSSPSISSLTFTSTTTSQPQQQPDVSAELAAYKSTASKIGVEAVSLLNAPQVDGTALGKLLANMALATSKAHPAISRCTPESQHALAKATEAVASSSTQLLSDNDGSVVAKVPVLQAFGEWMGTVGDLRLL